jgi:ribosome-binding protein aMBF1 (putative translation factor)
MKKKVKGMSLEKLLERQLKDKEFSILYDEQRFYLQVAHLVSDLRAKSGLSQAALAKRAKVSQPLIARLEVGDPQRTPTFDTIFRVLKALGYSMMISVKPESDVAA